MKLNPSQTTKLNGIAFYEPPNSSKPERLDPADINAGANGKQSDDRSTVPSRGLDDKSVATNKAQPIPEANCRLDRRMAPMNDQAQHIIVCDDEPHLREMVAEYLSEGAYTLN